MRDSISSRRRSPMNKGIVFLFAGGLAILIAAAAILVVKRGGEPAPLEPAPFNAGVLEVPTPLVIAERTRPIAARKQDAGAEPLPTGKTRETDKSAVAGSGGSIDAKEVNLFMNARFDEVKACYEHRLKTNSFLEGELDLNIEIALTGKVTGIAAGKDTVRDSQMLSCVKQVIRKWQFPKPRGGGVTVAKRFTFRKSAS